MKNLYPFSRIQLGAIYNIKNSFVSLNKSRYKVVSHVAMIYFVCDTILTQVTEELPDIPLYKFNLVEFYQQLSRVETNKVLSDNISCSFYLFKARFNYSHVLQILYFYFISDVIGILTSVQSVEQTSINNRLTPRRTLMIQNIRYVDYKYYSTVL